LGTNPVCNAWNDALDQNNPALRTGTGNWAAAKPALLAGPMRLFVFAAGHAVVQPAAQGGAHRFVRLEAQGWRRSVAMCGSTPGVTQSAPLIAILPPASGVQASTRI
jgi:hypothetical protein